MARRSSKNGPIVSAGTVEHVANADCWLLLLVEMIKLASSPCRPARPALSVAFCVVAYRDDTLVFYLNDGHID